MIEFLRPVFAISHASFSSFFGQLDISQETVKQTQRCYGVHLHEKSGYYVSQCKHCHKRRKRRVNLLFNVSPVGKDSIGYEGVGNTDKYLSKEDKDSSESLTDKECASVLKDQDEAVDS